MVVLEIMRNECERPRSGDRPTHEAIQSTGTTRVGTIDSPPTIHRSLPVQPWEYFRAIASVPMVRRDNICSRGGEPAALRTLTD